jgi:rfaE bifunctional protein nucleotidyltransferase chain/domain
MGIVSGKESFLEKAKVRIRAGERVVLTHGAFDLLHPGHIEFLENAQSAWEILCVVVDRDEIVQKSKGNGRPVIPEQERAELLAALACVDYVVIGDEDLQQEIVEQLAPNVTVMGVSAEIAGNAKRNVARYSTSALVEKAKSAKTPGVGSAGTSSHQHRKE